MNNNNLRLYFVTYNVNVTNPDQDLHDLLSLNQNPEDDTNVPDIYVISLQEVEAKPLNLVMDALLDDPWTHGFQKILQIRDYIKIKTVKLLGLVLNVFCLRKHLFCIGDVQSSHTRTGMLGLWGNKGAVSIRMTIYGCSVCFVNCRFHPDEDALSSRISDYKTVVKEQKFHVKKCTKLSTHDYIFWTGDLNFCLSTKYNKTPDEIFEDILKGRLESLLEHDELRSTMAKGKSFKLFAEGTIEFPPTCKFKPGSTAYDLKIRPAWTDRILYKVNSTRSQNAPLKVVQQSYKCHMPYSISDHKPVTADFMIQILQPLHSQAFASDPGNHSIQFRTPALYSRGEKVASVTYEITREIPKRKNDWIGVYEKNFNALDDYLASAYVKEATPITVESTESEQPTKFTLKFYELSKRKSVTSVRLIYVNESEHKVRTIIAMSDPIPFAEKEVDN